MNLAFERVLPNEDDKIEEVYEIIKSSGDIMFQKQGLVHWRTPYSTESIKKNCSESEVFLARDVETNKYVHTFQLEFASNAHCSLHSGMNQRESEINIAKINKFATVPEVAGMGIGKASINYIEDYCRNKGISKICLDVYDKSEHAIRFYKNRKFTIVGTKLTKHFTVFLMEKQLMKKILIIGAGFLQAFVIRKAKELCYYTITIDKNPNSIGFLYADEYGIIDIVDQEACLEYARSKCIDGVMTAATDYGVLSAAYVAQQMNLPGLNYGVAKVIKNKYMVCHILFENMVDDISQYYEIGSFNELKEIIDRIHFPVMVKPCDGSGSKAAKRVDSISHLENACYEAMKASLIGKALVEDFIEGKEYGVESFVYNGEAHVLGVMSKYMTKPPYYAELGHCIPSKLAIEEKVKEVVIRAINALKINFGAVNMDVLVTDDNRICIIDIGARMGGNLIGSHIIPLGTGIDYMGNLIRAVVGDSFDLRAKDSKVNVSTRLLALKPGKAIILPNFEEISDKCKVNIYHHLNKGDTIREYHNNLDGCGYVVAVADDIIETERRAEEAKRLIDMGIIREEINGLDSIVKDNLGEVALTYEK